MEANTQVILSRRIVEGEKDALRGGDGSWVGKKPASGREYEG